MSDPSILFVKPKAISRADKKLLQTSGIVVVEIDDPANAKFIRAGAEISAGQMLAIACETIANVSGSISRDAFGMAVCKAIIAAAGDHPKGV